MQSRLRLPLPFDTLMCMIRPIAASELYKTWFEPTYCLYLLRKTFHEAFLKILAAGGWKLGERGPESTSLSAIICTQV